MKACREKVRQEAGSKEEGGRGVASRGWEEWGFCLILIWTWNDIGIAICLFVLGSLWNDIVAIACNIWEKGRLKWN